MRLVEGDARELLAQLPAGAVDLVLTDPPYKFDHGGTWFREWFAELPDEEWPAIFLELYRVLARSAHAYVFCDARAKPIFDRAAQAAGFVVRPPLIWDKESIGLGYGTWRAQYEFIAWYAKGPALPIRSSCQGNVLRAARVRGYPSEKPVGVLRRLIAQASSPGAVVLDPFAGSGNVGRAARQLGRRAVLVDVDASAAERRLRVTALRRAIAS